MFTLTNINAMNAAQAVTRSHADVQTSMERLSTGSRINAARDDAAGLAMSQRMAAQIISIGKTIDNASDAVGLMNTADGALEEVSRLLQRMRELSVAAANGTQNSADLTALNNEYQMMLTEIARVGANTEWNEKKVFDGEGFPGETEFQVGANVSQTIGVAIDKLVTSELGNVVGASGFSTHSTTPPSAVTTQDSYTSHSGTAPSVQTTAGVRASLGSDIDGDGDVDLIAWGPSNDTAVYLNDGSGNFTFASDLNNGAAGAGSSITGSDIDGDGDFDLLLYSANHALSVYLNDGSGNFSYSHGVTGMNPTVISSLAMGDIDGDGDMDLVTQAYRVPIYFFLNDGSGNFTYSSQISGTGGDSTSHKYSLSLVDWDQDGDVDLMASSQSHGFRHYKNDGSGNFTHSHNLLQGGTHMVHASADLDGDRDPDVITWAKNADKNIFLNDGSGTYSTSFHSVGASSDDYPSITAADFNSDGKADHATWTSGDQLRAYTSNGVLTGTPWTAKTVLNGGNVVPGAGGRSSLFATDSVAATPAEASIDFSSLNLVVGDKVTIAVSGGSNVSAVMDSNGLNTLLTSLGNSLAAQSSLFSGASNSGGTLTINGLADGSAMPSLSVTLEDGVDTSRFDFNNKNLVEGDQVVIKVTGGTDVQGTIDSNGLDTLLGTLATQLQSQSSLFSNASVSSGVLSLTGLSNGSAITGVTVEMNTASSPIGSTNISSRSATEIALGSVDKAIEEVSSMRSKYGAATNRLTHAIDNLTEIKINAESSMSRIKDADYANETSRLAASQIINEAATSMLAQANNSQELTMSLIKDWL